MHAYQHFRKNAQNRRRILNFLCSSDLEHFCSKALMPMHFLSPEGGQPKYSIRVAPKPTEVLSKGGTNVRLVLSILAQK